MVASHLQLSQALDRVKRLTMLPDHRVREILAAAIFQTQDHPDGMGTQPLDRAVMLACRQAWNEERTPEPDGAPGRNAQGAANSLREVPSDRRQCT